LLLGKLQTIVSSETEALSLVKPVSSSFPDNRPGSSGLTVKALILKTLDIVRWSRRGPSHDNINESLQICTWSEQPAEGHTKYNMPEMFEKGYATLMDSFGGQK
jgi:hypothetical protein